MLGAKKHATPTSKPAFAYARKIEIALREAVRAGHDEDRLALAILAAGEEPEGEVSPGRCRRRLVPGEALAATIDRVVDPLENRTGRTRGDRGPGRHELSESARTSTTEVAAKRRMGRDRRSSSRARAPIGRSDRAS